MPQTLAPLETLSLIRHALRACVLFRDWPEIAVDRMARIAHLERYERRSQALAQDRQRREVLVVVSGCLETSGLNAAGTKFVLALLGPGEVVGLIRLHKAAPLVYSFHAHEDTVLVHLPCDALGAILDETPLLWKDVALFVLKRHSDSVAAAQSRALGQLQQILAQCLIQLAGWYGQPMDGGSALRLKTSQSDLASMLAVSRQTINKELRLLAQQGALMTDYGGLTLRDLPLLRRLAEGPCPATGRPAAP